MERLRGRVLGEGLWVSASLGVGDETLDHRSKPTPFELELDDGTVVEVDQRGAALGPSSKARDQWEDLRDDPRAEPFHDRAPGPHVKVSLEGTALRGGDRVIIDAEVERRPATEGYRGSDGTIITSARAIRIGVGEGAEAWLDERAAEREVIDDDERPAATPEEKTPASLPVRGALVGLAVGLSATSAALATWLLALGWNATRFLVLGLGLQLAITSVFKLARRRALPWMVEVGTSDEGVGLLWANTGGFATLAAGWSVVLFAWMGVAIEAASYAVGALILVGFSAWVLAFVLFWTKRKDARALKVLLRAKEGGGDGWGRREGTLIRGALRWDRTHQLDSSTSTETYTDSDGRQQTRQVTRTWYDYQQTIGGGPLVLRVGDGEITVRSNGGLWGSAHFEVDGLTLKVRAAEGDSVAVVGRFDGDSVKKGGPESLFLFTARGESATSVARRAMLMHRLAITSLVLLGALAATVGWINPVQDHVRLAGEVVTSADPDIAIGDRCSIDIGYRPSGEFRTQPHRCQVSVSCGGKQVYGGWSPMGMGYFDCNVDELTGSDSGADDEDGAIDLQRDRGGADHGDGRVLFRFLR